MKSQTGMRNEQEQSYTQNIDYKGARVCIETEIAGFILLNI